VSSIPAGGPTAPRLAAVQPVLYFQAKPVQTMADEDQFGPVHVKFFEISPPGDVIKEAAPIFEAYETLGANQSLWEFANEFIEFCAIECYFGGPGK